MIKQLHENNISNLVYAIMIYLTTNTILSELYGCRMSDESVFIGIFISILFIHYSETLVIGSIRMFFIIRLEYKMHKKQ